MDKIIEALEIARQNWDLIFWAAVSISGLAGAVYYKFKSAAGEDVLDVVTTAIDNAKYNKKIKEQVRSMMFTKHERAHKLLDKAINGGSKK